MSIIDNTRPETATGRVLPAQFPSDFLWGAATASYQIEGAIAEDGRAPSIWDRFAATPGKTYQGDTGEIAVDHYHRMQEDVALMAELGLGAYRFSVAWPRVLPQGTGTVNEKGLDFYDRLVDALLARGITPIVTLYHWDLPLALHDKGGWLVRETAYAFADYAEIMAKRLGDRVIWWTTHNEPWCTAYLGYGNGFHAPGMQDMQSAATAGHHVLLSHGLAVPRIRAQVRPDAQIGITLNFTPIYAADDRPETHMCVQQEDAFNNRWFIEPLLWGSYPDGLFDYMKVLPPASDAGDFAAIQAPVDFLGVNYYRRELARASSTSVATRNTPEIEYISPIPGSTYTDMGWEVYPDGLRDLLIRLHKDYTPGAMLVTENGAAFRDSWDGNGHVSDPQRMQYLHSHIQAVGEAMADGVPVRGYFAWSLLDNFEWVEGYNKRFGIVYVDYATQRRIVKESGRWYASFMASQQSRQ
jgi:beta-glucosidase